jgi:dTDP-4-dehydrorhamnose 3,5-epimerase-like enzyme
MIKIPAGHNVPDAYIQPLWIIDTKDPTSREHNGYLRNIVNPNLGEEFQIGQVYATYCLPSKVKGPHVHWGQKTDRFYCIGGRACVVCRNEQTQEYSEFFLESYDEQLLIIPPYNSHAIVALDAIAAVVLSIPTEGYKPGETYNQIETEYSGYDWSRCK